MTKVFINETLNDNVTVLPSEQGSIITITSSGAPGVTDHAALSNLGYAAAGHTGFEPSLPTMVGASLKFLQVNLAENAKQWTTVTMTPAGADTQVQFNNAGAFGANANFVFLTATERFGVGIATPLVTGHFKRAVGYAEVRVEVTAAGAGALLTAKNDTNSGWYTGIFTSVLGGAPVFFGLANAGGCFHTTWGGGETWVAMGPQTAIPLILGTNNVERMRFLPSGGTNRNLAEFNYIAAAPGADAVGDWRYSNQAGTFTLSACTVLNVAKGAGTWTNNLSITSGNVVSYLAGQVWKPTAADSTGAFKFQRLSDSAEIWSVDSVNCRVGIGTITPTEKLEIKDGHFYINNSGVAVCKIFGSGTVAQGRSLLQFINPILGIGSTEDGWDFGYNIDLASRAFSIREITNGVTINYRILIQKLTGNVGIGITTPICKTHIDFGTATAGELKLTCNATTGVTATDGFGMRLDTAGNASLWQYENLYISVGVNNGETLRFLADKSVRITNNAWFSALDFAGTGTVNMFKVNVSDTIDVGATINTLNVYPIVNDTYYLGKNSISSPLAYKGLVLKDTTNGNYYRIEVINSVITATQIV